MEPKAASEALSYGLAGVDYDLIDPLKIAAQRAAASTGTHLVGHDDAYIYRTIEELRRFGLRFLSPCHCTGFKAMAMLYNAFPETFVVNYCGRVFEAGKEPRRRLV